MDPLLQINQLNLTFHTPQGLIHALRNVSLSIHPGEVLALVGESGCGKSVLCKSILRLLPKSAAITGGQILFGTDDLTKLTQKKMDRIRGRHIAAVFQDPYSTLDPSQPVGTQICEAILTHRHIGKRAAQKEAVQLLMRVGIPQPELRYRDRPHQFSGGQRQRIAIAIALACHPALLIADEITTALDAISASNILELVSELLKQAGASVLFVTHDLGAALRADRIAVMYAGQIVEIGTSREIACEARHPYTWALLSVLLSESTPGQPLDCLPGSPPNLLSPPVGDAFAPRNRYAMQIDFEQQPPLFSLSPTHYAATWLCHPSAPPVKIPIRMSDEKFLAFQLSHRSANKNFDESRS